MSQTPGENSLFTGFSEFGAALAIFVAGDPDTRGAIVTDAEGDPVDFAHRPRDVSALDLQIAGAQVEQTTTHVQAWCARHGLGSCEILIEASHGLILSAAPGGGCVLSSLHGPRDAHEPAEPAEPVEPAGEASAPSEAGEDRDPDALLARFAALHRRITELIR